jgi:cytochrome c
VLARCGAVALALAAAIAAPMSAAAEAPGRFAGIGRTATAAEIRAWDIDVRKDFAGLPKGAGSVGRGQEIWDAQCASCHGTFGESNEVFPPIVGGTTPDDAKNGVVRSLTTDQQRSTLMKLSSLATLWDYIRRAMPWNAPKSLPVDDVYAVTAYILHLGDLVPASFVLSDANIRETDRLLPNRNGMTTAHGMWNVRGRPDVRSTACMRDCDADLRIHSSIPEYARNAHGNLALQNREIGGVRGVDTTLPALAGSAVAGSAHASAAVAGQLAATAEVGGSSTTSMTLANRQGCLACHAVDRKVVGPGFREIAARYRDSGAAGADDGIVTRLAGKIRGGAAGAWGSVPMPAQAQVSAATAEMLARWIAAGAQTQ